MRRLTWAMVGGLSRGGGRIWGSRHAEGPGGREDVGARAKRERRGKMGSGCPLGFGEGAKSMLREENGVRWERERCERIGDLSRGAAPGRNGWESNR